MSNVFDLKTGEELPPDFITRVDISRMTDAELDIFIEKIKLRRMASFVIYQQTQADLELVKEERARERLNKKMEQISKTCDQLDKNFEKLEKQINEMRGLRIQAGLQVL